jgi:LEA14-like dessication related protein
MLGGPHPRTPECPLTRIPALSCLLLTGCHKIPDLGGVLDKLEDYTPRLSFDSLELVDLSWEGVDVAFIFQVENPNPVALELASLSYDLSLEGSRLLQGDQQQGVTLAASGTSPVTLPVSLKFEDMLSLVGSAEGRDELGFSLSGEFGFETPLGTLKVPYTHEGELPVLRAPTIKLSAFRMGGVDLLKQTASMEVDLLVTSEQSAALTFRDLGYALTLDGADAASGKLSKAAEVAGEATITLPVDLNFLSVGATLIQALVKKEPVELGVSGEVQVETPLGTLPLSFERARTLAAGQ